MKIACITKTHSKTPPHETTKLSNDTLSPSALGTRMVSGSNKISPNFLSIFQTSPPPSQTTLKGAKCQISGSTVRRKCKGIINDDERLH